MVEKINHPAQMPKDWLPVITWSQYFYRQQLLFNTSPAWIRAFIAANGTGKTFLLYWNAITYALGINPNQFAPPPLRIRCLVPSFDNVTDVALPKLYNPAIIQPYGIHVGPMLPKSMVKKDYSKDHKGIELKNGSSFSFVTEEQGWRFMRGAEQDVLIMDEESSERVFDENLRGMRNAKNGGKVLIGLTPPYQENMGPTWTKEKLLDAALQNPDIKVFKACMADNPANTPEFIKRFSEGKSPEQIQVQIYGKYPTWGTIIHYPFQNRPWNGEIGPEIDGHILPLDHRWFFPDNFSVDWLMAFDWHPSKECAAIWCWIDSDGNCVVFDELAKEIAKDKGIGELSDIFHDIERGRGRKWHRYQDPSARSRYQAVERGFNAWDEFRHYGIRTAEGRNRDPERAIAVVNDYLRGDMQEHPRLFIRENCKYLIHAMENHFWVRTKDNPEGKPDTKWSDYPICLRYILGERSFKERDKAKKHRWPLVSYEPPESGRKIIDLGRYI